MSEFAQSRPDDFQLTDLVRQTAMLEADRDVDRELIADLQDQVIEQEMAYRHLEGALQSSRQIGCAMGIVMAHAKVTEDEAFTILSTISQRQNRKLRLVAESIVLTGTF